MKILNFDDIKSLNITPGMCVDWVESALKQKYSCFLPCKISTKIDQSIFFNTMPVYIPFYDRFGVKIVSRYPERKPSLQSDILLFDTKSGDTLALMDGSWITAMRTGAVAASTIRTLKKSNASEYAFLGLGNTARATLLCLLSDLKEETLHVRLLAYKGQEVLFMERFSDYNNIKFTVYSSAEDMIKGADVVVSCVTVATELIASDDAFQKGVLVVPVHTRGFQNCDLFFDKVFADDTDHVKDFKYFDQFKSFDEISKVLLGEVSGRENDQQRILVYNIGIALHDIYFASNIYDKIVDNSKNVETSSFNSKYWV